MEARGERGGIPASVEAVAEGVGVARLSTTAARRMEAGRNDFYHDGLKGDDGKKVG
jgi:hypothetical protein